MKNEHWLNSKTYQFHQQRVKSAKSCLPSQAIVKSKKLAQGTRLQSKFASTTNNFDLTIDEKNELFKIPIYQALKLQGLQQYVRELITMGLGYDLSQLSTMSDAKLSELIEQLKFLPGHKQRFLKLMSDLRTTNLGGSDNKENRRDNALKKPRKILSAPKKKPEPKKAAIQSEKSIKLEKAFSSNLPKFVPVSNEKSAAKCFNVYSVIKPNSRPQASFGSDQLIASIIKRHTSNSRFSENSDKKKSQNSFQTASHKTFMDDFLPNFTPVKAGARSIDALRKTIEEELFRSNSRSNNSEKQKEQQNVTAVDLDGVENLNLAESSSEDQTRLFVATMIRANFVKSLHKDTGKMIIRKSENEDAPIELLDFNRQIELFTIPEQSVEYTMKESQDFTLDNLSLVEKNSYMRISNRLSLKKDEAEEVLPSVENVSIFIAQLSQELDITKDLLLKAFATFMMMCVTQSDLFETCGWMSLVAMALLRTAFNKNIQLLGKLKTHLTIRFSSRPVQISSEVITSQLTQNTNLFEQIEGETNKNQQRIVGQLGMEILNFNSQNN